MLFLPPQRLVGWYAPILLLSCWHEEIMSFRRHFLLWTDTQKHILYGKSLNVHTCNFQNKSLYTPFSYPVTQLQDYVRFMLALWAVRRIFPQGGRRHQIFKAWDHSRFNKERRTDVNFKGEIMELIVKQKVNHRGTFSFNINNLSNICKINKYIFFFYRLLF